MHQQRYKRINERGNEWKKALSRTNLLMSLSWYYLFICFQATPGRLSLLEDQEVTTVRFTSTVPIYCKNGRLDCWVSVPLYLTVDSKLRFQRFVSFPNNVNVNEQGPTFFALWSTTQLWKYRKCYNWGLATISNGCLPCFFPACLILIMGAVCSLPHAKLALKHWINAYSCSYHVAFLWF